MKTLILLIYILKTLSQIYPVLIFHGLNSSCKEMITTTVKDYKDKLTAAKNKIHKTNMADKTIKAKNEEIYVDCIETSEYYDSVTTPLKHQSQIGCNKIKTLTQLYNQKVTFIGFSQGALIARDIIQNCDALYTEEVNITVARYISFGGPQMGISQFPSYFAQFYFSFKVVYCDFVQFKFAPAGYFKDINNFEKYIDKSSFLADVNNERKLFKQKYKDRILKLEKMVLVLFGQDEMVIPKESSLFRFNKKNIETNKIEIEKLEESKFFEDHANDRLGIAELYRTHRVDFVEWEEQNHLEFRDEDIDNEIIPYLVTGESKKYSKFKKFKKCKKI
jgi:palmitoyl-protein thioesterase